MGYNYLSYGFLLRIANFNMQALQINCKNFHIAGN